MRKLPKERGKKMLTENDTKGAWKFIREATFTVKKDPQNKIDPVVVNDYLASTVQALTATKLHVPHTCDSADSFRMDLVSNHRVQQILRNLKTDTATGPDKLPVFLLKELAEEIALNITLIINSSIKHSIFPAMWKKANVTAIWKNKGSKTDPPTNFYSSSPGNYV